MLSFPDCLIKIELRNIGKVCAEPEYNVEAAFQLSNRTHVGDIITYQCKLGFSRLHENADSIRCESDDGIPKWKVVNQLEHCIINYCNLTDLRVQNADLHNTSMGNFPDGMQRSANQSLIFSEGTMLTYRCFANFQLKNAEFSTARCTFPENHIGLGYWEPAELICTGKHANAH